MIFHKTVGEFYQIYNFGALGTIDKLIRFWGQKVCNSEGEGHDQAKYSQNWSGICIDRSL